MLSLQQFQHYKDEMFLQAQRAFGVSPDRHYRLLHAAAEEKPRIIVLNVLVQAADNLEAKDANGKPFFFCIYIQVCSFNRISPHSFRCCRFLFFYFSSCSILFFASSP